MGETHLVARVIAIYYARGFAIVSRRAQFRDVGFIFRRISAQIFPARVRPAALETTSVAVYLARVQLATIFPPDGHSAS